MKKGKKIAIIILVIVIAIVAVFSVMVVNDLKQEENLTNEMNTLYDLIGDFPLKYDEIESKLNQTVTTGSYYEVEIAVKSYMSDIVSSIKQLDNLLDEDSMANVLSASNIKEDGPNFTDTKQYLKESKETLDKVSSNLSNYFTEEKAMTYIENKELDNYYVELYKKYATDSNTSSLEQDRKEITDTLDQLKALLSKQEEIIDFLVKNKRSWKIEDDTLVFYSESLSEQYTQLTSELENL